VDQPSHGTVVERIRARLPSLSRTAAQIAAAVAADPGRVVQLTVSDLAAETGTSVASVVRFCQDIGLRGFGDLKLRLAAETASVSAPAPGDGVLQDVLRASSEALAAAVDAVDADAFAAIVDVVAATPHLLVAGVGTSAPLAQDCAYRLRSVGLLAEAPPDAHVQHVAAAMLGPGAVLLAISHTGQTRETLETTAAAREAGATTVAVTSFHRSPLTELADHVLVAGSRETRYQVEARVSRLVHSAVLDALHAAVVAARPASAPAAAALAQQVVASHRL
jgi:DNA-binding MurR/RpiR family transcriptional regulator